MSLVLILEIMWIIQHDCHKICSFVAICKALQIVFQHLFLLPWILTIIFSSFLFSGFLNSFQNKIKISFYPNEI